MKKVESLVAGSIELQQDNEVLIGYLKKKGDVIEIEEEIFDNSLDCIDRLLAQVKIKVDAGKAVKLDEVIPPKKDKAPVKKDKVEVKETPDGVLDTTIPEEDVKSEDKVEAPVVEEKKGDKKVKDLNEVMPDKKVDESKKIEEVIPSKSNDKKIEEKKPAKGKTDK